MASTNQSPFYQAAEKKFLQAQTDEERIMYLEEMIKECPKHKGAENMLANLKTRYKKLKLKLVKSKKSGKGKKESIKKQPMQALITGMPNTGKSSLFKLLTNLNTKISPNPFTTFQNQLGTTNHEDVKIQLIDTPSFPNTDQGLINSINTILLITDNLNQIPDSLKHIEKSNAKIILIHNKSDLLNETEKRKLQATLTSKHKNLNPILFSSLKPTQQNVEQIKKQLFETFPIIRVYTKEPRKPATKEPMILPKDSTIQDTAEKILKGMSQKIKHTKIWGPSSKFPGQVVGLNHILKDKDTVEFQTK